MLSLKILANDIDSPISITSPLYVSPSPILMGTPPGHCILYMTHVYEADSSIVSSITFCTMAIFSPSPESIIAYSTPSQNPIYFSDIVCFSHETSITSAVRSKSNLFITYIKSVSWPYTMMDLQASRNHACKFYLVSCKYRNFSNNILCIVSGFHICRILKVRKCTKGVKYTVLHRFVVFM